MRSFDDDFSLQSVHCRTYIRRTYATVLSAKSQNHPPAQPTSANFLFQVALTLMITAAVFKSQTPAMIRAHLVGYGYTLTVTIDGSIVSLSNPTT